MGLGDNYGAIFDCDVEVERVCRRVRIKGGWKWQLVLSKLHEWGPAELQDRDTLDAYGHELEFKLA